MASSGFAGGLAEGLNNIMQLHLQSKYYGGLNDARDRNLDLKEEALATRQAKAEGGGGGGGKGEDYEGLDNSLRPIFTAGATNKPAAQTAPVMANQAGLAGPSPTTLPDAELLTGNPAAAYQTGSLAAPTQAPAPAEQTAPEEQINPRQEIVKQMMFGNLANEPDKLNAIAAAAALHGLGGKITPWLEGIYRAKKSGVFDGAMSLINNDVDGAIDNLKRGGIKLADRPTKVAPDDPNDHRWNINIEGTGQRVMDVRNMVASTMDADKFSEFQNKTKVANAQADSYTANAEESRAKAKSYAAGGLGVSRASGGGAKAASVRKVMETDKGILAIMSDGSKRVITGDDGKPSFGTSNLKIAAGLVGKTLDPLGNNNDIADRVNTVAGQLGGGGKVAPAKINELPEGAKMIGTSKGKPVYEVNGKRFIPE
jgi:hypothetical protein